MTTGHQADAVQNKATRRQQSTGNPTHKAAGCSEAAAAGGQYRAAQAASDSPLVLLIIRLCPQMWIPQHHWLQRRRGRQNVPYRLWLMTREHVTRFCKNTKKSLSRCCLVEVGGGAGAVHPVHTPLHVCVGGLGARLPSHPGYQPLRWAAACKHADETTNCDQFITEIIID